MSTCQLLIRVLGTLLLSTSPGWRLLWDSSSLPPEDLRRVEQQVHQYVNQERTSIHLPELKWNEQLAAEARRHAGNLAAGRFFAHKDPARGDIDSRLNKSGIDWLRCAENLYEGNIGDPAVEAVREWLHSSGHRKNMLDSMFRETGVGAAARRDGMIVIVQVYILK